MATCQKSWIVLAEAPFLSDFPKPSRFRSDKTATRGCDVIGVNRLHTNIFAQTGWRIGLMDAWTAKRWLIKNNFPSRPSQSGIMVRVDRPEQADHRHVECQAEMEGPAIDTQKTIGSLKECQESAKSC